MADAFFNELKQWVYSQFDRHNFPEDVTRLVFRHIRTTPDLFAKYQARSQGDAGQLHIDIGKMVKERLEAEVIRKPDGKPSTICCNPNVDFVTRCTRLRPSSTRRTPPEKPMDRSVTPRTAANTSLVQSPRNAKPAESPSPPPCDGQHRFPFGQPLLEVRQEDRRPKKVFVLGVYASAVHARWIGPGGRDVVKALAVASEPYIFWRGDGAEAIIEGIRIPGEAGRLVPADPQFNGPSGVALDEMILNPLGLTRDETWLCDLVPHSCVNPTQQEAIERAYLPLAATLGLPLPSIPPVPSCLANSERQQAILAELMESQADTLILLGDQPICWFLSAFNSRWQRLSHFDPYGQFHDIVIGGRQMRVLPLAHPRQVAKLGRSSPVWYARHAEWAAKCGEGCARCTQ